MSDRVKKFGPFTELHLEFGHRQQSLTLVGLYEGVVGGKMRRLRVDLERNAYDFQSHGRVEIFSPSEAKWNYLAHIEYSNLAILKDSYVQKTPLKHWADDVQRLLERAELILGERLVHKQPLNG